MATEATTGVKWYTGSDGDLCYLGDGFSVYVAHNDANVNWWIRRGVGILTDNYAPDFATAKAQAERWILKREGRLPAPAPATDGGWIACSERMPELNAEVEVRCFAIRKSNRWYSAKNGPPDPTHWRPRHVDPHAVAACLFDDRYRPTVEQARAAARHVAGCAECRAKLEAKGGA